METEKRSVGGIAVAVFAATALFHGLLVFVFFPPSVLTKYPETAREHLQGQLSSERLLDFSPLYLELHTLVQRVSARPSLWMDVLHVGCSALSVSVLFLLLVRFFRKWLALAGTVAFLLDRSLAAYVQVLEPEPILMALILLFAYSVTDERPGRNLAAGLFLGLAVLTRPNFLPLLVAVPIHFYLNRKDRRILTSTIAFAAPVLALIIALWIRNAVVLGYFSPLVMNPGTVFFEGNNPNSIGLSSIYPPLVDEVAKMHPQSDYQHVTYRMIARKTAGKNLTLQEVNRYWVGMSMNYLQDHPAHAAKLCITKAFHVFHAYQWHDTAGAFWNEQWLRDRRIPALPFGLISALAIAGLIAGVARWRSFLVFYAILAVQVALMMVTYVSARQRLSILWVFAFFACAGLEWVSAGRRRLILFGLPILLIAFFLQVPTDLMTEETRLWHSIRRSNGLLGEAYRLRSVDRLAEASAASAASLASAPFYLDTRRPANLPFPARGYAALAAAQLKDTDPSTIFDEAVLLVESGEVAGAETALQRVTHSGFRFKRDFYQSSEPYYYLARVAMLKGDRLKAQALLQEAERRSPGDPSSLALLYVLSRNEEYARALIRYFGELDARFYIGRAALAAGAGEIAVRSLEYVRDILPDFRRGRLYLAAAYGMAGRVSEGESEYRAAMRLGGDPVLLEKESVSLFASVAAQRPGDAFAQYSYGVVLRQFGHYREAIEVQRKAMALQASSSIRNEIAALEKALAGLPPEEAGSNRP